MLKVNQIKLHLSKNRKNNWIFFKCKDKLLNLKYNLKKILQQKYAGKKNFFKVM